MENIENKIVSYLNGNASDDESRELMKWIQESPANGREFARVSLIHGQLRSLLSGETKVQNSGALEQSNDNLAETLNPVIGRSAEIEKPKSGTRSATFAVLATLAASLVIALGIYFGPFTNNDPVLIESANFAMVGRISDVVWKTDLLSENDRIGTQTLELQSGILRLQFDSGVDVTLEGPAKYELVSSSETRLHSGVLVANVPQGAEGFRVDTPSAQVVDLGTSFGVNVGAKGDADVLVFDGEVEVFNETDGVQKITEGEAIHLSIDGSTQVAEFNPSRFEKLWPVSSGIAGSTGAFQFVPPWPIRIRTLRSNEEISLVPEGYAFHLKAPLRVNISEPGDYNHVEQLTPTELPIGNSIRSYLLHYLPAEKVGPRHANRLTGSITFDQPVVGLILLHEELVASSRISRLRAGESQPRRQLELTGEDGDRVTLSEDRLTLTVELVAPGRSADLIRVIVEGNHNSTGRKKRKRNKRRNKQQ